MATNYLGISNWKRKKQIRTMIMVLGMALLGGTMVTAFIMFSTFKR
jgi:flagellar basal body-associated protein FliL